MWSDSIAVFGRIQINSRALQFCRLSIRGIKAVLIWWILLPRRYTFADQLVYTTISRQCMLGRWWKDPCSQKGLYILFVQKKLRQLFRGQWPDIYKSPDIFTYMQICMHASASKTTEPCKSSISPQTHSTSYHKSFAYTEPAPYFTRDNKMP